MCHCQNLNENPINLLKFNNLQKKINKENSSLIENSPSKLFNISSHKKIILKKILASSKFSQRTFSESKMSFPPIKVENHFAESYISLKKPFKKKIMNQSKSAISLYSRNEKKQSKTNCQNYHLEIINDKSKYFQQFFYNEK